MPNCKRGRSRSLARKSTSAAAAKRRRCQEDAQQRNNFASPSALFGQQPASTIVVPSGFCHGSTVVRAPSKGRCRRSAVAVKPAEGGLLC